MLDLKNTTYWKLTCANKKEGGSLEDAHYCIPFEGTFNELKTHMTTINSKNYSYKIIDFNPVMI